MNHPLFYSLNFLFPAIVISSLFSSVKYMTKNLPGISLFSLICLVYARIRICTIEVTANTQQVLDVPAQKVKPLRLHRTSRVTSCPKDFVYRTIWLIPELRLVDRTVYPCRNSSRSFWVNVNCFDRDKPFYLLTLIQGSTILYGTQSVGQLVTWIGLCSRSGLPV